MRNYIKKQILRNMNSLISAEKLLRKIIKLNYNAQNELVLLQDMQEVVIEVGETVEKHQGKGLEIVQILEEVCELLWEISQSPISEKTKLCKSLHRKLEDVQKQIRDNIPAEFEIVFLPYKVSMWDSLESLWRAAKEDSSCMVYVIPIPYFDKKENGTLGEIHYEGWQFPEYVSVTDFREYDFESRHPDIIYFHNPYDAHNFVTSVHPFFYSASLKKYTDRLIYIPYYVCSESTREENCLQSGILNADTVIVQSEKIKHEYIKYYSKRVDKNIPVDKFLALGAPKFDKVIQSSKMQNELTIQWKERAGNRKIIFYNTHLNTFLKYEERAIKKLKVVFQYFAQRDDVLLLWRPHPLCKATLKAMRPELYGVYVKEEKEYLEKNIGIYDESIDIYSAISVADGYYGDSSSVLSLFGITGKPICIQDVSVTDYDRPEDNFLRFEAAYLGSEKTYFASRDYDMLSGKWHTSELAKKWLDLNEEQSFLAGRQDCCMAEGNLYAACLKANIVLEYNLQNEKIEIYQVGNEGNRYITITYDGSVFWLTTKAGNFIRWNKETGETKEITISLKGFHIEGEMAFASSLYADGYVWLFAYSANMNIRVNVHTFEMENVYEFTDLYEMKNPVRVLKNWYEDGKVCFVDAYHDSIVRIDETGSINESKLTADKDFRKGASSLLCEVWKAENEDDYRDYIHRERDAVFENLKGYLDYITVGESSTSESQKKCFLRFTKYPEGNSGEMIHRKMTGKE